MKKILLLAVIFLAVSVFSYAEPPVRFLTPTDTVYGDIQTLVDDVISYGILENVTDENVEYDLTMEFPDLHFGHQAALCWEVCFDFTEEYFKAPMPYNLAAHSVSLEGQFAGHLRPYKLLSLNPLLYSNPVTGTSTVKYTVIPTDGRESSEYLVTFIIVDGMSVNDFGFTFDELYPNPASNMISINLGEGFASNSTIGIYDVVGNLLKTIDVNAGIQSQSINISDLPNGTYHLNLRNGNKQMTKKFSVAR